MDTAAIAQYLANTLKAAQSYDLLVLKSLVADMTVGRHSPEAVYVEKQKKVGGACAELCLFGLGCR